MIGKDDFFMGSGSISRSTTRGKETQFTSPRFLPRPQSSQSRASHYDNGTDVDNDVDEDDEAGPRLIKTLAARQFSRSKVSRPISLALASLPRSTDCPPVLAPSL